MTALVDLALDCETHLAAPYLQAPPIVCTAWSDPAAGVWLDTRTESVERLRRVAADPSVRLVNHTIAFDLACHAAADDSLLPAIFAMYDADRVLDVGTLAKLHDIAAGTYRKVGGYGLDDLSARHLGVELDKGEDTYRKRYAELDGIPFDQWPVAAVEYPLCDAAAAEALAAVLPPHKDAARQSRAQWWLHLASCWGMTTDPKAVDAFEARVRARHDVLSEQLGAAGLIRPDGTRDTKVAKARMTAACEAAGLKPTKTATGEVCLDKEACERSRDPLMAAYGEYASFNKQLTGDLDLLRTGIVQPWWDLLNSGRAASSPNTQNWPTDGYMRSCCVPRPGFVYVAVDYSTFELYTLAQACINLLGRSKLAGVLNAGGEPHDEFAASLLGISVAEVQRGKKTDERIKAARQSAKIGNYGFGGGMGATRMVEQAWEKYRIVTTEPEVRRLKRQWLQQWPEMNSYFRWANEAGGRVELPSGFVRSGMSYCDTCNTPFQGLAATIAKEVGYYISRACYVETGSPLHGCRLVNFMHDEYLLEAPEDQAHEAGLEMARIMVDRAGPWLPDVPPKTDTPALMRRWLKSASSTIGDDGRLTICE